MFFSPRSSRDLPARGVDDLPLLQIGLRIGDVLLRIEEAVVARGPSVQLLGGKKAQIDGCVRGNQLLEVAVPCRVGVGKDRVVFQRRRQLDRNARAIGGVVDVGEILRSDAARVLDEAVAGLTVDAEPHAGGRAERDVQYALQPLHVVVAGGRLHIAFELIRGALRHEEHRAARRVATEQRALRPLEYLHVLQVEKGACAGAVADRKAIGGAAQRDHIGEIDADRWRGAEVLHEAADRIARVVAAEIAVRREGRRECGQVGGVHDIAGAQLVLVEHRHGNRHVLEALLDAPGGHQDVLDVAVARGALGVCGRDDAQ